MNEIFRFMTIRSAQLVDPASAIDLSTFIQGPVPGVARASSVAAGSAKQTLLTKTTSKSASASSAAPKTAAALHYASLYKSIYSQISITGFDPTTTSTVIGKAVGSTPLSSWVTTKNYLEDKNAVAVALVAAHLDPPQDNTVEILAQDIRVMNLIDAIANGAVADDSSLLSGYLRSIILAPPGLYSPIVVGPPYNPYVVPAGVADLQVVNQQLLGYQMREISYIANVLQSETQKRATVRFEKTDQTFTTTTDTTTQTEQDSQSEERFQVQTQAQKTIQDDASLKFGISISASYGPSVQAKSNFDVASSSAMSDSNSVSTNYSKDVTTRAVASVTQEVSQQQRLDIINSFKETFEHGFDNAGGTGNICGVYQYVDAQYEVGVFNYGQRLLLDLIVPNPGAFIRDAIKVANGGDVVAYDPPPITFTPSDLTIPETLLSAGNSYPPIAQWVNLNPPNVPGSVDYTTQAQIYQVQGLTAPPDPYVTVCKSYTATVSGSEPITLVADSITIPAGYEADSATVVAAISSMPAPKPSAAAYSKTHTYAQNDNATYNGVQYVSLQAANTGNEPDTSPTWWANAYGYNLSVTVGSQFLQWGNGLWAGSFPNSIPSDVGYVGSGQAFTVTDLNERGSLTITVSGGNIMTYVVGIEVMCLMTNEAFEQWQLSTFTAINQAYLALLSTYQEATSQNQQALAGTNYPGSSPDENTRVVQTELKREVISLVTLQQFDPPTIAPAYASGTTYAAGAIVSYNNVTYVSLVGGNSGNEPDTNPIWWSTKIQQYDAATAGVPYSPTTPYAAGNVVLYPAPPAAGGIAYVSLQGNNLGNEPDTSPDWWATNADAYVDPNLPAWSGQGSSSTRSAINFQNLFQEAPLIRFMEEGFEWDQMQYIFYPYYWNQKDEWFKLALIEDPDYLFNLFLRAGAARVVVPVRPGFEEAFIYYLQSGQPWNGGSVPQVYDPLYLSIATEIAEADAQPVSEVLVGQTWTLNIPTTLTKLRATPPTIPQYSATATYPVGSVVTYEGVTYISSQIPYSASAIYATGAVVNYNQETYVSIQNTNTDNEPDMSPAWWTPTANTGFAPDGNPAWWSSSDPSLPSWTLDDNLNVLANN